MVDAAAARPGRPPVTTRSELELLARQLFTEHGFEATTVDQIAAAAGIARRTFFRYFSSKNDIIWGDFQQGLADLRTGLAEGDPQQPLLSALVDAVLAFNALDPSQEAQHRSRMELILRVPALQAHSTLMYAAWRQVIAEFAAIRLGTGPDALLPQLVAHSCLGASRTAYEQWLQRPDSSLPALLAEALHALDGAWGAATSAEPDSGAGAGSSGSTGTGIGPDRGASPGTVGGPTSSGDVPTGAVQPV